MNSPTPFATTMDYNEVPAYAARAVVIERSEESISKELRSLRNVLRASRSARAMVLDSNSGRIHPDLLATILMRLRPVSKRPVVIFIGDMWQKDPGLSGEVQKLMLRLADPAIARYAPLSTGEFPLFAEAWGIAEEKLRFLPYFYTFRGAALEPPFPPVEDYIFSGGNTHRDYAPLIEAARALPDQPFILATRRVDTADVPANVTVTYFSHDEFVDKMRRARAVVVPMRRDLMRSAGHQTYLNAMMLRRPVIVNDILGVADHVRDGETGLVVDGSPAGYIEAIRTVTNPANREAVEAMAAHAREVVAAEYTLGRHAERVMQILDEALAEQSIS